MPFFQYTATDRTGKRVNGALQAATPEAARAALMQAGLSTVDVRTPNQVATPAPAARTAVATFPPQAAPIRPMAAPVPQPHAQPQPDVVKSGLGNDSQLYFLLTQLAGLQNAGIAPSLFFRHLADKAPKAYKPSLEEAAIRTGGEGASISDIFERYPNLYPKHVVGDIRVGEKSGYFAEGVNMAADSVEKARRLAGRLAYFPVIAAFMVILYPLSMGVIEGCLNSMKEQDKSGGSLPIGPTLMNAIGQQMKTYGPTALACGVAIFVFIQLWKLPFFRRARHFLGYCLFPSRARSEAVVRLSWGIGRTAKAGIPHYAGYQLAVDCIPNEVLRERVANEAARAREGEPLSAALRRSMILPPQYADVVETGEMTGDIPRAMEQLTTYANSDFDRADSTSVAKGRIIFLIALGILTTIFVVSLCVAWYGGLIKWGTSEEFMSAIRFATRNA